jgi:hypothetical protein
MALDHNSFFRGQTYPHTYLPVPPVGLLRGTLLSEFLRQIGRMERTEKKYLNETLSLFFLRFMFPNLLHKNENRLSMCLFCPVYMKNFINFIESISKDMSKSVYLFLSFSWTHCFQSFSLVLLKFPLIFRFLVCLVKHLFSL